MRNWLELKSIFDIHNGTARSKKKMNQRKQHIQYLTENTYLIGMNLYKTLSAGAALLLWRTIQRGNFDQLHFFQYIQEAAQITESIKTVILILLNMKYTRETFEKLVQVETFIGRNTNQIKILLFTGASLPFLTWDFSCFPHLQFLSQIIIWCTEKQNFPCCVSLKLIFSRKA